MRRLLVLILVVGVVTAVTVAAGAVPLGKRDVCHLDADSGLYQKINISENAFEAHVAHGDAAPLEDVPGMPGYGFDENCVPTAYVTFCNVNLDYPFVETFGHATDDRIFYQGIMELGFPGPEDSAIYGGLPGQYRTDASGIGSITTHAGEHELAILPGFNCFVTQTRAYGGL